MRLFKPIDSFDPLFSINRRQVEYTVCGGGNLGSGLCMPSSSCTGVLYTGQCRDNAGDECCFNHTCRTDRGVGRCRDRNNQTCAGDFVVGSGPDYPCPGPDNIICCVEWENLVNSTTSSNPPTNSNTQTETQTTLTTTSSSSSMPSPDSGGSGLSASQKGGIAGGIVGAVVVTSIIFLVFFFLRRRKRAANEGESAQREGRGSGEEDKGNAAVMSTGTGGPESPVGGGGGETETAMLASREKLELDACGRALHEMETPPPLTKITTRDEKGPLEETEQVKVRRLAELPGSLAVAEMPVPFQRTTRMTMSTVRDEID